MAEEYTEETLSPKIALSSFVTLSLKEMSKFLLA